MKIIRSYSRKVQVKQYEPVEVFCAAEMECKEEESVGIARKLSQFCYDEVERDLGLREDKEAMCESCGGIVIYSEEDLEVKGGLCPRCRTDQFFKAKDNLGPSRAKQVMKT